MFYFTVFNVMGKALSGELSCTRTSLVFFNQIFCISIFSCKINTILAFSAVFIKNTVSLNFVFDKHSTTIRTNKESPWIIIWKSDTMVCSPVRGENPWALASGLSLVQVDKPWYSRLSLSRSRRDPLKHFEISVLRHIRCAELRKIPNEQPNFTNEHVIWLL